VSDKFVWEEGDSGKLSAVSRQHGLSVATGAIAASLTSLLAELISRNEASLDPEKVQQFQKRFGAESP
jgi:hypothetical protein